MKPRPAPTHEDFDTPPPPSPRASLQLHRLGWFAIAGVAIWFVSQAGQELLGRTLPALAILVLACLPALRWVAQRRTWFPAFEISMLACVAFYALPLLTDHTTLAAYPPVVIGQSAGLVVLYLAMANIGFSSLRNPATAPHWAAVSLLPLKFVAYVPVGLALNTAYLYAVGFTDLIPPQIGSILRALFFGVGVLCTFILARQWGAGQLTVRARIFVAANLALQCVFLFADLYLIRAISILALACIAFVAARHRVPWLALALVLPVVALLHLGKPAMRDAYWRTDRPSPGLAELPAFFDEWVDHSLAAYHQEDESAPAPSSIIERASLIQMLCLSVDRVPSLKPYLDGESYLDIPALIIPRVFWPDKPSGLLSNVRLALHFNLVDADDPDSVSIAFGVISESYINFGFIGVVLLGFLTGVGFKWVSLLSVGAPQFSALGIFMILLTAWSFQAELVMASWITSLFQAAVACIGGPLLYRKFTVVS